MKRKFIYFDGCKCNIHAILMFDDTKSNLSIQFSYDSWQRIFYNRHLAGVPGGTPTPPHIFLQQSNTHLPSTLRGPIHFSPLRLQFGLWLVESSSLEIKKCSHDNYYETSYKIYFLRCKKQYFLITLYVQNISFWAHSCFYCTVTPSKSFTFSAFVIKHKTIRICWTL